MIDLYPWFGIITSLGILAFAVEHLVGAQRNYRRWHDDRAAIELLLNLMWCVAAVGLTLSASATFVEGAGVAGRMEIRNAGLGLMRGAMLIAAATLFVIEHRENRGGDRS
jgi:hypothetical protein